MRLLCLLGIHKPKIIRCQPRKLTRSLWSWFDDVNFDYGCDCCVKVRYGDKGRWDGIKESDDNYIYLSDKDRKDIMDNIA